MRAMFALLWVALLLPACAVYSVTPNSPEGRQEVERAFDAANDTVVGLFDEQGRYRCSGVWVGNQILSAAHCRVEESNVLQYAAYRMYSEQLNQWVSKLQANVAFVDVEQDLLLLDPVGPLPAHNSAAVAPRRPYKGEVIYPFGHPWGLPYYFSQGIIIDERRVGALYANQVFSLHNAPLFPGMSGGPVFNFEGDVIGINSFYTFRQENIAGMVHVESIRTFYRNYQDANQ